MAAEKPEKRTNELGPCGEQVAANVRIIRAERQLTTRELAEKMTALGRPIPATGITRLESRQRRVDADDLVALAVALGVTPSRLLLPLHSTNDDIHVTPDLSAPWAAAWRWVTGDQPLLQRDEKLPWEDPQVREFIRVNRPYEHSPIQEAYQFLGKRVPAPFEATITDKKANLHRGLSWEEWQATVGDGEVDRGEH